MKPTLGWVHLTREDVSRASARLSPDDEGIRDELGLITLHQAVADRLFPGTSVLHTRLRYAVFVPWLYEDVADRSGRRDFDEALKEAERQLAQRLKDNPSNKGVIGRRVLPRAPATPPSVIYWTALCSWGVVRSGPGGAPSRRDVQRILARGSSDERDDAGALLRADEGVFSQLPGRPKNWFGNGPLDFNLEKAERVYLRSRLASAMRPDGRPSLLSTLADMKISPAGWSNRNWFRYVRPFCEPDDAELIDLAAHAADLSAICRGVYAALCEALTEKENPQIGTAKRDGLPSLVAKYRKSARYFDRERLASAIPSLRSDLLEMMASTAKWSEANTTPEALRSIYEKVEFQRKDGRSRLQRTALGQVARRDWIPSDEHPWPLHYRWPKVRQLLEDLA